MVIFDSTRREVKSPRPFGRGILRSTPNYKAPFNAADVAWLIAERLRAEDRHFDRMAAESEAMDRYERGLCC